MADIPLSNITSGIVLPRLAPDLSFPSGVGGSGAYRITGIDGTGGLTTALSLTGGAFSVSLLEFTALTSENVTIKLTIDGVVIWNDTFVSGTSLPLLGVSEGAVGVAGEIQCESYFLLEIQTTTDTSVTLDYLARPIL